VANLKRTLSGPSRAGLHPEHELTEPVPLCDSKGRLLQSSIGWSRHPLHTCNLSGHWPRKKRWNFWGITNDTCCFSVLLADLDYTGLAKAYFLEYETKRFIEQTVTVPLGRGCDLPATADRDVVFENKAMSLSFLDEQGATRVRVQSPAFGGTALSAELLVERPKGHESINVVIPWSANVFDHTSKQICLPASGTVSFGDHAFSFEPGRASGCLDFSRGIWPYSTFWNWACFSGIQNGRSIGINLGGSWTDGTGMTENGICVDGRVSKISEDLHFSYNPSDQMKPWTITAPVSGRIDLRVVPFFERVAKTNQLVIYSEFRQVFGRFSGTLVPDDGQAIEVADIIGWVEQHRARW
jgi:hypothetical protein